MAVNRYDSPAQAKFMDTYVPIPFEQLYTLGKQAKADVDKAVTYLSSTLNKWSEFQSPSEVDTKAWYAETLDRATPIVDKFANNLDLLKTVEGRSEIYSLINNVDRAKLSSLKQSRDGLLARQKVNQQLMLSGKHNPLWHDVDFSNYDTSKSGIYNDIAPLAYRSIKDLTDPYVNNLKDSFLGRSGGFIHTGVTKEKVQEILDANKSGILNTPEAQKHMDVYMQLNPGSTREDAADWIMQRANVDNKEYVRDNVAVDPYAMQDLKYRQSMAVASTRKGKQEKESTRYPDAYKRLYAEAVSQDQHNLTTNPVFAKTQGVTAVLEGSKRELIDLAKKLEDGQVTPEIFEKAYEAYVELENKMQTDGTIGNALAEDIQDMFAQTSNIYPKQGFKPEQLALYHDTASRVLNQLTYKASGKIMNTYNNVSNANEVEINSGDVPTKGYISPDSRGAMLATDYVGKAMKVAPVKYMVNTSDGLERNFGVDLENGVFTNVIKVPRGQIAPSNINGSQQLVQRVSLKIPLQEIKSKGYDERSFKKLMDKLGIPAEEGLNVKPTKKSDIEDNYGYNSNRAGSSLTGTYYTFDIMEPINPLGMTRMTFDQEVNDIHGGSKLQNEEFDSTFLDSFSELFNNNY